MASPSLRCREAATERRRRTHPDFTRSARRTPATEGGEELGKCDSIAVVRQSQRSTGSAANAKTSVAKTAACPDRGPPKTTARHEPSRGKTPISLERPYTEKSSVIGYFGGPPRSLMLNLGRQRAFSERLGRRRSQLISRGIDALQRGFLHLPDALTGRRPTVWGSSRTNRSHARRNCSGKPRSSSAVAPIYGLRRRWS